MTSARSDETVRKHKRELAVVVGYSSSEDQRLANLSVWCCFFSCLCFDLSCSVSPAAFFSVTYFIVTMYWNQIPWYAISGIKYEYSRTYVQLAQPLAALILTAFFFLWVTKCWDERGRVWGSDETQVVRRKCIPYSAMYDTVLRSGSAHLEGSPIISHSGTQQRRAATMVSIHNATHEIGTFYDRQRL